MKSFFTFLLIASMFASCKRAKDEFLGPGYISAPSGFEVTSFTASTMSVDFTVETVDFNVTFPQSVSWILIVTGQESGAVKKYSGTGSSITNLSWIGTHDEITFFRVGETAKATLSFYGNSYTTSLDIIIVKSRNFKAYGIFPKESDFENRKLIEPQPPLYSAFYASFNYPNPIANVKQGVDSFAVDYNGNLVPSVQGRKYYYIKGKGEQPNFVSGIQYTGGGLSGISPDPENVYVNFYLYGTGDDNAQVEIEFQESDQGGSLAGYQGWDDDAFVAKVTLNHTGWKLFSFPYSKLTPSLNADFGGSGNKKPEPNRILSIVTVLVKKSNPDSPVELYYDFPIITMGGPFDPSK